MARPLRLEFPGALYHVASRGNARQEVFLAERDREVFLETLAAVVGRYGFLCHAYCLMGNHYHIVLETVKANLSLGMRQLNGVYTQAFNRRHGRVGHLFQGRYKAVLVERESHLLELCRYLALNPVRAGLCAKPEEWPWSSYRASAELAPAPPFLSSDWILSQFAGARGEAAARYRAFVRDGLGRDPFAALQAQVLLGGEEFVARHREELEARGRLRPPPSEPERPPLSAVLSTEGEAGIVRAYRVHGYRLHEIAAELGVHEATVSRRLRRLEESSSG